MSDMQLIPVPDSEFTPRRTRLVGKPLKDGENYYKIYHDGGHYVATRCTHVCVKKSTEKGRTREAIDILFNSLYFQATKDGLKDTTIDKAFSNYIRDGILKLYPKFSDIDEYVAKRIKRMRHNLGVRKKRFKRKAFLNKWNYYVTFTFDDKKQTPESFEQKLCKCFSNLKSRHGWRVMGKFENAPDTGRLHFHGLIYVPHGEMVGTITEKQDYSTAQHKMQIRHENDFFEKAFGRNDFTRLNEMQLKHGKTIDYIVKYISKDNGRVFYSRGIPTEVVKVLTEDSIITDFMDYVPKYVLFDNVLDWERDILRKRRTRQMSIIDLICNPPRTA